MAWIVFEGIDGCGKTTLVKGLAEHLAGQGAPPLLLREPGSTALGESLRDLLLRHGTGSLEPWTEALLFTAARAEMVATRILPALAGGGTVLLDRYFYSTMAYQGGGSRLGIEPLLRMNMDACRGALPDAVVFLRTSLDVAAARLGRSPDRMESRPRDYMERVRQAYEGMAAADPARFMVVDGEAPAHRVLAGALDCLRERGIFVP